MSENKHVRRMDRFLISALEVGRFRKFGKEGPSPNEQEEAGSLVTRWLLHHVREEMLSARK